MRKLTLLLMLLLLLGACASPAAPSPSPSPAPMEAPAPDPSPTLAPSPEPAPEEPPAMAEDGEHPRLIAHAGGAVYGYRLTNSLEALDRAWEAGFRFIELDFQRTSDGEIVLIHDWAPSTPGSTAVWRMLEARVTTWPVSPTPSSATPLPLTMTLPTPPLSRSPLLSTLPITISGAEMTMRLSSR